MAARRRPFTSAAVLAAVTALGLSAPLAYPPSAAGQELAEPQVENSKFSFSGVINANAVFVHSGPSNTFYPTAKLDKGTKVKVVGIKYNWLKIEPPPGSFSYVAKAYVTRRGDGKVGRVTNTLNVRAGSVVMNQKTTVQTKLENGQDVQILGEQDEYFKIVPPPGAYLYVDQRYVDPLEVLNPKPAGDNGAGDNGAGDNGADGSDGAGTTAKARPTTPDAPDGSDAEGAAPDNEAIEPPTTRAGNGAGPNTRPASRPTQAAAGLLDRFNALEADFKAASAKPVVEQPLDPLTRGYQALAKSEGITASIKRVVDARLAALKLRTQSRDEFVEVQRRQAEARKQRQALIAEGDELQERIKANDIKLYTAVGTLRTSSLQIGGGGGGTLYRLTDPETGRTVVYVRGTDANLGTLLNQFIGLRGPLAGDPQLSLRVINNPTAAEIVDQTKVNATVAAQVIPPSLLPKVPISDTASTDQGAAVEPQ